MTRTRSWLVPSSAVVLAIAGCASRQGEAAQNPGNARVAVAQQSSEQNLQNAIEAQEKATQAQARTAQPQADVQRAQQQLQQAQQKAVQAQAEAQRLQQDADEKTRQATQLAQASQQQAAGALGAETKRVQANIEFFAGQVSQASGGALRVTPASGDPMTFRITSQTQLDVDGRRGTLSEIQPGSDARVAYQRNGTEATATSVQVVTGKK
jgi:hypothetical protein